MALQVNGLLCSYKDLRLIPRIYANSGYGGVYLILRKCKQEDHCDSLPRHSSLIVELRPVRFCVKGRWIFLMMIPEIVFHATQLYTCTHALVYVHMHTHTRTEYTYYLYKLACTVLKTRVMKEAKDVVQLVESLAVMHEALGLIPVHHKLDEVACAYISI